jgi:hypothetical protein
MEDYPRREFTWDSRHALMNGYWLIEVEEGDKGETKCHQISEEDRIRMVAFEFDSVEGLVRIWGCREVNGQRMYENVEWVPTSPAICKLPSAFVVNHPKPHGSS